MAHQGAKKLGAERQRLQEWISKIEHDVFQLPIADLVIHLDLPAETAQGLIAKKSKRDYADKAADLQEADRDYLDAVRQSYLELAAREATWRTVPLLDGDQLRSIEEIGEEIAGLATQAIHAGNK